MKTFFLLIWILILRAVQTVIGLSALAAFGYGVYGLFGLQVGLFFLCLFATIMIGTGAIEMDEYINRLNEIPQ
ncbi:MAG TPA: hypothetical protein VN794_18685 [Methylomirabilota bacterium]|nr:hypothetical protein [Methylomirabilota bacterium]